MANAILSAAPTAADCDVVDALVARLGVREVLSMVEECCRGNALAHRTVGSVYLGEVWDGYADIVAPAVRQLS